MSAQLISIQSERIVASVHPFGAELRSIRIGAASHEVMWQRDAAVWEGSAPILFPIVGGLKEGRCLVAGREYRMPRHGLVRRMLWDVVEQSRSQVTFACGSSAASREAYPWDWRLEATFRVQDDGLRVNYEVSHPGDQDLLFSLGSHPAFNLDFGGAELSNYHLDFVANKPVPGRHKLAEKGLSVGAYTVPWEGNRLPITPSLFDEDALVFKDAGVGAVVLGSRSTERTITLNTGGAPDLGIWAKPGAPFVCIEPWFGYHDPEDHEGDFFNKPGLVRVRPGAKFCAQYAVLFNEVWF
jgi:galactose mutarotase-like enzyme